MKYSVKCTPIKNGAYNVVGIASVVVDDKLMVNNIQLVQNDNNYEVHYPSRRSKKTNTGFTTIAYPADQKLKKKIMSAIISSYKKNGERIDINTDTPYELTTKISPFERDNIRGFCRISFSENNEFRFNDIMLRDSSKGIFVDFPSYKTNKVDEDGNTVYNSVINPFTKEFYAEIKDILISEYEEVISEDDLEISEKKFIKEDADKEQEEDVEVSFFR